MLYYNQFQDYSFRNCDEGGYVIVYIELLVQMFVY